MSEVTIVKIRSVISGLRCHEVMENEDFLSGSMLARPSSWDGSGKALTVDRCSGTLILVSPSRSAPWIPTAESLGDWWELVDPDLVTREVE